MVRLGCEGCKATFTSLVNVAVKMHTLLQLSLSTTHTHTQLNFYFCEVPDPSLITIVKGKNITVHGKTLRQWISREHCTQNVGWGNLL